MLLNFFKKKSDLKEESKEPEINKDLLQYTNSYLIYIRFIKALIDDTVEEECSKRYIKDSIAETKTISMDDVHKLTNEVLDIVKVNIPIGFNPVINFLYTDKQIELMVQTRVLNFLKNNYTIYTAVERNVKNAGNARK